MVGTDRLAQMSALLSAMGNRSKPATDGLGVFLGDGIPRPSLGELRSNELKSVIDELVIQRACADYEWALDALIEGLRALNAGNPHAAKEALRRALWTQR